jgi:plasmid maintenance system antidote protein VapI
MVIEESGPAKQAPPMPARPETLLPELLQAEMRPERIGYRLRLLRLALEMSSSEMADALDIERTYWSRFEGGKRPLTEVVAALLVARYGVTLDWLILGRWDALPFALAQKMRAIASGDPKNS